MSGKRKLTHPHAARSACDTTHGRVMNLLAPEFEYMGRFSRFSRWNWSRRSRVLTRIDCVLIDPNPDIHALFIEYDRLFFDGKLVGCEVKWSKRMTLWYAF
jgi:hypothetical protein